MGGEGVVFAIEFIVFGEEGSLIDEVSITDIPRVILDKYSLLPVPGRVIFALVSGGK